MSPATQLIVVLAAIPFQQAKSPFRLWRSLPFPLLAPILQPNFQSSVVTLRPMRTPCLNAPVHYQFIVLFIVPIVLALHFVQVEAMRLTSLRFHQSQLLPVSVLHVTTLTLLLSTLVRQAIILGTQSTLAHAVRQILLLR
jgi:hypothetical protein